MNYAVLKDLKFSPNGISVIDLIKGDTLETDKDVQGLIKEGFLKEQTSKKEPVSNDKPLKDGTKETKDIDDLEASEPVSGLRARTKDK